MKQTYTDKDYFEEKFTGIEGQITHLTKILEGNGKPGLIQRMESSEGRWAKLYAAVGVVSAGFVIVGMYIRGFIEQVWRHLYEK